MAGTSLAQRRSCRGGQDRDHLGTFDVFHVGHVRVLSRSAALGDRLVVGVSSDQVNFAKKGAIQFSARRNASRSLPMSRLVDAVFIEEESLEQKRAYLVEHQADIVVMGDDWSGKFDFLDDICQVRLPAPVRRRYRRPRSSSTLSAIPGACTGCERRIARTTARCASGHE